VTSFHSNADLHSGRDKYYVAHVPEGASPPADGVSQLVAGAPPALHCCRGSCRGAVEDCGIAPGLQLQLVAISVCG
jgi:hypothetical protein